MVAHNDQLRAYDEVEHLVRGLVLRGSRNGEEVARVLQQVHDHTDFLVRLGLSPRTPAELKAEPKKVVFNPRLLLLRRRLRRDD